MGLNQSGPWLSFPNPSSSWRTRRHPGRILYTFSPRPMAPAAFAAANGQPLPTRPRALAGQARMFQPGKLPTPAHKPGQAFRIPNSALLRIIETLPQPRPYVDGSQQTNFSPETKRWSDRRPLPSGKAGLHGFQRAHRKDYRGV